jgi:hypothetical protein
MLCDISDLNIDASVVTLLQAHAMLLLYIDIQLLVPHIHALVLGDSLHPAQQ